jgi:hypothetical protein
MQRMKPYVQRFGSTWKRRVHYLQSFLQAAPMGGGKGATRQLGRLVSYSSLKDLLVTEEKNIAAAIPAPTHQITGPPSLPFLCLQTGPSLPHTTAPNFTINISGTSATNSSTSTSVPTVSRPTNFTLPSFGADQPLAIDTLSSDPRSEKWAALLTKYGRDKLDAHEWEWKSGDWLPRYRYQPVEVITDIWTEYVDGLNGHLSTRELKDRWGAKWRRNEGGLKTEAARRSKVVSLVEQLSARPNWNVSLALRFLVENYENTSAFVGKVQAFCDYLQKDGGAGFQAVIAAASRYPS